MAAYGSWPIYRIDIGNAKEKCLLAFGYTVVLVML